MKFPMAGRRKATARFCQTCEAWHGTHRSTDVVECERLAEERYSPPKLGDFPHIRTIPRTASR